MDREKKRKATDGAPSEEGQRSAKKLKLPDGATTDAATARSVTEVGTDYVRVLKQTRDKNGRSIAENFLFLPRKKEIPEYYQEIALPVAINTIESKLRRHEYRTVSEIESDGKRMVENAKAFNQVASEIYDDAERLGKITASFMIKHNPAYNDKLYVAAPTPIPPGLTNGTTAEREEVALKAKSNSPAASAGAKAHRRQSAAVETPPEKQLQNGEEGQAHLDFTGKSLQQAQDIIITELIQHEDSGLTIFTPFINLPSRSLTDYYSFIKHPTSLRAVLRRVRGFQGRSTTPGSTEFRTWELFENEVTYIWRNAKDYNEDGSDMYNLASEFEEYFRKLLTQARAKVAGPQPSLKLKLAAPKPSIKLRLGGNKVVASTDAVASASNGQTKESEVIVDSKALARQQEDVEACMNGKRSASKTSDARSSSPPAKEGQPGRVSNGASPSISTPAVNGVKAESHNEKSPAPGSMQPPKVSETVSREHRESPSKSIPSMASSQPRLASGSPLPPQNEQQPHTAYSTQAPTRNYYVPPSALENRKRPSSETAADSILPLLFIRTHPALAVKQHQVHRIEASDSLTQVSRTINLPRTHPYIQILPSLSSELLKKPYQLFVSINGQRLYDIKTGVRLEGQKPSSEFEARLVTGVNRIEVEAVTISASKNGISGQTGQLQTEKMTVFAQLLRT